MSVELSKELWNELKRYVNPQDRNEAVETMISVLIDNDIDADEIKDTFKSDPEVKRALVHYLKDHEEELYDDEDEDNEDDNKDY
jgi:uncharacterized protein (UPF0305 family)